MTAPKKVEALEVDAPVEDAVEVPKMKRRDMLAVSALLRRNKLDPTDMMAMGLATQFLQEKKAGETELSFQDWLDEPIPDDDDDEAAEDEEDSPMVS